MSTPLALVIAVLLLVGNGFFTGAEFAITSARRAQLEPLAGAGDRRAATALWALEHVSLMLATCQLGVTLCSTGLGIVAEPALAHVLEDPLARAGIDGAGVHAVAIVLALVIVVFLHVVAGEMVPKNLSIASPERAARILAPAIVGVSHVFGPVVTGLNEFANWTVRIMGLEPKDELAATFNAEEVASIVERSTSEGVLDDDTGLLSGALEFSEETAGSVMVPLQELVVLEEGCTPEDVERAVASTGFSRFPLVAPHETVPVVPALGEGGRAAADAVEVAPAQAGRGPEAAEDEGRAEAPGAVGRTVTGYLHLKDVLYADAERDVAVRTSPVPARCSRALVPVHEADEVEDVLVAMQRTGAHLGRVEDSDGRMVGVVFLEDILEELVGEVNDAMQREEYQRRDRD
ncbi:hemolysin family protein [Actinomyces radicidentis]|uniref:hemolysin family protein n=1 Tax=Actinomyces radicidentis TaxID=111015 RepID=UPI0028EA8576|nr:hemolysin family protein [Actinomyces radicidentis]